MMRIFALIVFFATALRADPTGLWAAKGRFGPDIRGSLTMDRARAEIAGYSAAVHANGDDLTFEIPDGGSFR